MVYLKGSGIADLLPQLGALLAFALVLNIWAVKSFKDKSHLTDRINSKKGIIKLPFFHKIHPASQTNCTPKVEHNVLGMLVKIICDAGDFL